MVETQKISKMFLAFVDPVMRYLEAHLRYNIIALRTETRLRLIQWLADH
jgi:hypothetical protein